MPTATPTLAELAAIAHTNRCSVVTTRRRQVLLDDTASSLPFHGIRFGPGVEAVAAPHRPTATWTPIRPALASWFDEGSFARHCFASLPDLDIVVADLHELLGSSRWR